MKLIKAAPAPCPCQAKLWEFYNAQACDESTCPDTWGIGTQVECDCGVVYTLAESQREGRYWVKKVLRTMRPAPADKTWLAP